MHFTTSSLALSLGLAPTALALPHSNPHFAHQAASRPVFIGATDLGGDGSRAVVSGPLDVCVPIPAARANTFESIQTQEDISCIFFENADCTGATEVTFIPAGLRGTNFFQDLTVLSQKSESWICRCLWLECLSNLRLLLRLLRLSLHRQVGQTFDRSSLLQMI